MTTAHIDTKLLITIQTLCPPCITSFERHMTAEAIARAATINSNKDKKDFLL